MKEGRVTANGLQFAYLEEGSGPLVMLLHGFGFIQTLQSPIRALVQPPGTLHGQPHPIHLIHHDSRKRDNGERGCHGCR